MSTYSANTTLKVAAGGGIELTYPSTLPNNTTTNILTTTSKQYAEVFINRIRTVGSGGPSTLSITLNSKVIASVSSSGSGAPSEISGAFASDAIIQSAGSISILVPPGSSLDAVLSGSPGSAVVNGSSTIFENTP